MRVERIHLTNFLSFASEFILLKNRGLLLVSGKNGSGKSSLFSKAITWALFGQTPDGLKGDSVIRLGENKTEIELNLDGLSIVRQRPHSLMFYTDTSEECLEFRNATEAQQYINNKIQRDFTTFINADYFGQGRKSNFINESSKTQLEILEEILGLNKLDKVIELTKERISSWSSIAETEKISLLKLEERLCNDEGQKAHLTKKLNSLSSSLEASKQNHKNIICKKQNELKRISLFNLEELKIRELQVKGAIDLEYEKIRNINYNISNLNVQFSSLSKQKKDIIEKCPSCDQQIDINVLDKLKKEQELLDKHIEDVKKEIDSLNNLKTKSNISLINTKNELEEIIKEKKEQEAVNINYDRVISELEKSITELSSQIEFIKNEIERTQNLIATTSQWLDTSREDLKQYENQVQRLKFWQNIFSKDFKNFVIRETLPFIEERTRYHLNLLNNSNIEIKFSTIKELKSGEERSLFNILCKVKNGGSEYNSLSGGEKQIASFAIGLTLSELVDMQNGEPSSIIILDEPFTELDGPNCENVVNYLTNELSKKKETIILISNDDRMKSLVPNVIEIEKDENGISRINE